MELLRDFPEGPQAVLLPRLVLAPGRLGAQRDFMVRFCAGLFMPSLMSSTKFYRLRLDCDTLRRPCPPRNLPLVLRSRPGNDRWPHIFAE